MSEFLKSWNESYELRNALIFLYAFFTIAVILMASDFPHPIINQNYKIATMISITFLILLIAFVLMEWLFISKTKETMVFVASGSVFFISVMFAIFNSDSNIIVGGATIILVIITAYNISKTDENNRKLLKYQIKPLISVTIKENDNLKSIIDLAIENVGVGIAENIRFDIQPRGFITLSGDPLEKLFIFRYGIPILSPKQQYVIHLTEISQKIYEIKERFKIINDHEWREKLKKELQLTFIITYENIDGDFYKTMFTFNLCMFWGLRYPKENTPH